MPSRLPESVSFNEVKMNEVSFCEAKNTLPKQIA